MSVVGGGAYPGTALPLPAGLGGMGVSRQPPVAREVCIPAERKISPGEFKNRFPLKMERSPAVTFSSPLFHRYSYVQYLNSM